MAALVPGEKARMYALGGVARGGATRGGYLSGAACISIGGVDLGFGRADPAVGVIIKSLTIKDLLDEAPNTCSFRVHGAVPAGFAPIVITLGTKNRLERLFAGTVLTVTQRYAANNPKWVQADCTAVDPTWQLGFVKVTAQYRGLDAGAIAGALVALAAADGFTAGGVAAGLPLVDEITFTNEDLPDALTRLARRIGGYWYVDYHKVVHLFFSEVRNGAPETLTPAHPSLRRFTRSGERTQGFTRVYVEGRGTSILAAVPAGATVVPVETVEMLAPAPDVFVKASFQGAEGGAQHLAYTGIDAGGGGSLVGPGAVPGAAPAVAAVAGAGIESGTHTYGYTWVTAAGESAVSPLASVVHGTVPGPTGAPTYMYSQEIGWSPSDPFFAGDSVRYGVTYGLADEYGSSGGSWLAAGLHTPLGPVLTVIAQASAQFGPPYAMPITFSVPLPTDARVQTVHVWRSVNGGTWYGITRQGMSHMQGWGAWPISNEKAPISGYMGTNVPAPGNVLNQSTIAGVAIGPAAVTARKIYRTSASGSQLKLLQTLANNTATSTTDAAADATLGANAPAGDTSGLPQPTGQVNPGAAAIVVASAAAFRAGGGWAVIGNGEQVIRYTGITGNSLSGVPASGPGAIVATVVYNSTITAAPLLLGVPASGARSILRALTAGDEVYLVVQCEDAARQADLAAKVGGPGWREEWVQDRRLSSGEARKRGQATLAARPLEAVGVKYQCRDLRTSSGKDITVNLPAPTNVSGTYKIQAVTIDNFRPRAEQQPTFTVDAAALRFTFEEWLRLIQPRE